MFSFLDGVRYNENFVKSRFIISRFFCHTFYCNFGRAEEIVRYTENFVIERFVKSRFHCRGWGEVASSRRCVVRILLSALPFLLSPFVFRSCFVVFSWYTFFLFLSASFPFFVLLALNLCFARLCDSRISSFCLFLSSLRRHFPNFNFFLKNFALHIIFELIWVTNIQLA